MYLWKCWRESRLFFILSAALFVLLTANYLAVGVFQDTDPAQIAVLGGITAFVMLGCLVVWYFGQTGLGRHFNQNAGDFLLTRPRLRRFLVWSEWGFGISQAALLIAITGISFYIGGHLPTIQVGHNGQMTTVTPASQLPLLPVILLTALSLILLAGLLVSLAQFFSFLLRNGGYGLTAGLAAIIIYLAGASYLARYRDIHLPNLFFVSFHAGEHSITLAPGFALQLLARIAVVLAFPLLTQLILERVDI